MCAPYRRIANERESFLAEINPNTPTGLYCPEAADAVHDFLTTGDVAPLPENISGTLTYPISLGGLVQRDPTQIEASLQNCEHVVVQGRRDPTNLTITINPGMSTQRQITLSATHWFVVMRYNGMIHVVDAYLRRISHNLSAYMEEQRLSSLHVVTGQFDVRPVDPLSENNN